MSLLMSCIMSFVVSVFNVGLVSNILIIWLKAWAFAFVIAFPTIVVVSPIVNKLVSLAEDRDGSGTVMVQREEMAEPCVCPTNDMAR